MDTNKSSSLSNPLCALVKPIVGLVAFSSGGVLSATVPVAWSRLQDSIAVGGSGYAMMQLAWDHVAVVKGQGLLTLEG
jgi:hypothetical protein